MQLRTRDIVASALAKAVEQATSRPARIAYSIDEAADALGVTRRTVEGMIDRGELKSRLVGRKILISVEQLQRLFK